MTPDWLQSYLVSSVSRNLCTTIHCTTCGAMDFRRGVLQAAVGSSHVDPRRIDRADALDIAIALAGVRPVEGIHLDGAVR